MRATGAIILLAIADVLSAPSQGRELTYNEYLTELNAVTVREKTAREGVAREQAQVENLKQQIAQVKDRIASAIQEKYSILGITEEDVVEAEAELDRLRIAFEQYQVLSGDDLLLQKTAVNSYKTIFDVLSIKPVSRLYRVAAKIREVESALKRVLAEIETATGRQRETPVMSYSTSTYTVGSSGSARNLWEVAREVYNDQYQWPRIYRANKKHIDRRFNRYKSVTGGGIARPQDFLVPGWVLEIPQ
jgi:nucleoid-associated protein YgaU